MKWIGTFGVLGILGIVGCGVLQSPALPNDLAKEESCIQYAVEQGVTNILTIATTCAPEEEQFVADFISALLSSSWAASHASLIPAIQQGLATYKAGRK
jgi:hypothetical protein